MPDLGIRALLDLSTSHLSYNTGQCLGDVDGVIAYRTTYGWLMHVPEEGPDPAEHGDWPPELLPIFLVAQENGCEYVLFDADGPQTTLLPVFAW